MRYQRTQVYLDPEEHAALVKEAAGRGISLAELMRELVSSHVRERAPTYETKSWNALFDIAGSDEGESFDIVENWDEEVGAAFEALYEASLNRPTRKKPARKPSNG